MSTIIPCLRTNNRRMCGEGGDRLRDGNLSYNLSNFEDITAFGQIDGKGRIVAFNQNGGNAYPGKVVDFDFLSVGSGNPYFLVLDFYADVRRRLLNSLMSSEGISGNRRS